MPTLADVKPDSRNARRHNARNVGMIESSIQRDGFGRSILLANDGTIIAGNATIDAAASVGMNDVEIIESDGTKIIAIQRTDVEPYSREHHHLALADNRAAELADWCPEILLDLRDDTDLDQFFTSDELTDIFAKEVADQVPQDDKSMTTCPACGHVF
jgi:hypothetical protein